MNRNILNLGFWSAILCLTSFIVWIISFTGIAIQAPLFQWTNMDDYIRFVNNNCQFFQYLAKFFMIVFSLAYMLLSIAFQEITKTELKIFAKIGVVFAVMFSLVSSVHYFVQISSVRFAIAQGELEGLGHFLQSNPSSSLLSVNMIGWTLFLGLSAFFLYSGFTPGVEVRGLKTGLLVSMLSCLFGGIGYIFQIKLLTVVFMNLGIGLGLMLFAYSSVRYFWVLKQVLH